MNNNKRKMPVGHAQKVSIAMKKRWKDIKEAQSAPNLGIQTQNKREPDWKVIAIELLKTQLA